MKEDKESPFSFVRKIFDPLLKRFKLKVFESWEKEKFFRPPTWFQFLELKEFGSKFVDLKEEDKIKYLKENPPITALGGFIEKRLINEDYTFPFPKFLYNIVYDVKKRLPASELIMFYTNLRDIIHKGGGEANALQMFKKLETTPPLIRKIVHGWEEDIYTGIHDLGECLIANKELFGNFETELYNCSKITGSYEEALGKIINSLKEKNKLEKAQAQIKKSFIGNSIFIIVSFYYVLAFQLPVIFSVYEDDVIPTDLKIIRNLGEFLATPAGFITTAIILVVCFALGKVLVKSDLVQGLLITMPGIGDFNRFVETYNFVDVLDLNVNFMEGSDEVFVENAIKVVNNSFVREFFTHKLNQVRDNFESIDKFFINNEVFGSNGDYMQTRGDFKEKLPRLRAQLEIEKDEQLENLPKKLESLVFYSIAVYAVVLTAILLRIDLWSANPATLGIDT